MGQRSVRGTALCLLSLLGIVRRMVGSTSTSTTSNSTSSTSTFIIYQGVSVEVEEVEEVEEEEEEEEEVGSPRTRPPSCPPCGPSRRVARDVGEEAGGPHCVHLTSDPTAGDQDPAQDPTQGLMVTATVTVAAGRWVVGPAQLAQRLRAEAGPPGEGQQGHSGVVAR
jgi:hypothetical protein